MRRSTVNNARIRFKRGAIFTRSVTFDSAQVTSYPSDAAGGNLRTHLASPRLSPANSAQQVGRSGKRYKVPPRKKGERRGEEGRESLSASVGTAPPERHACMVDSVAPARLPNLHHSKMGLAMLAPSNKIYIDRVS